MGEPQMNDSQASDGDIAPDAKQENFAAEVSKLRAEFEARLVAANLRTEAVRAGMVDLDGLKLMDLSGVQLDPDDKVVGSRQMMDDLRRRKPWLFGGSSSSSGAVAPVSHPVCQKSVLDMTDEEYKAARAALLKRR
jgi:hypothetical protein